MSHASPVLTTERLILRPLTETDADDLVEYHSDPDTVRYIPWPERTHAQVVEWLRANPSVPRPEATGDRIVLGWQRRDSGHVIGQSNLSIVRASNHHAEVGWVTHPRFTRHGYALEATLALLDWAFPTLHLHRVTATIDMRNPGSARLAERLGMRREAEHIEDDWFKGEWTSTWIYAVLAREWSHGDRR